MRTRIATLLMMGERWPSYLVLIGTGAAEAQHLHQLHHTVMCRFGMRMVPDYRGERKPSRQNGQRRSWSRRLTTTSSPAHALLSRQTRHSRLSSPQSTTPPPPPSCCVLMLFGWVMVDCEDEALHVV